jgi:diguanylate cyclase (GGDEF)-like protein
MELPQFRAAFQNRNARKFGATSIWPPGFRMKRHIPSLAVALALTPTVWASAPSTNVSVRDIRSLSRVQAEQHRPVVFEATVTYYRPQVHDLFVQQDGSGIYIETTTSKELNVGDRVLIRGTTHWGYRANVVSNDIVVIGHSTLPKPILANYGQLIRGSVDSELVTVRGVIHAADTNAPLGAKNPIALLKILTDEGYIGAEVLTGDTQALKHLLDAEVEITGVDGGKYDGKMQLTGVELRVSNLANVKVIKPAANNPWTLPPTPMDEVLSLSRAKQETSRVRVVGTATYFEPGSALVLQSGDKSIWAKTNSFGPMHVGDQAEVTGFPDVINGFLVLTGSSTQDTGIAAPITPEQVTSLDLRASKHIFDLVSVEGTVVMQVREPKQDEYVLLADGQMFSAIYSHRVSPDNLPPMLEVPVGSKIRVTGVCTTSDDDPYNHDVPFDILIRSTDDIQIVTPPSILTVRNLTGMIVILLLSALLVGARALLAGGKMRAKVAELGYLSHRRSEILEDINRSRQLPEILERITELGSVSLKGAPCWCRIADGPTLGNCPAGLNTTGLRTIEIPICSPSGNTVGSIYAAFDANAKPRGDESKSLSAAAALATLAIETSRLHSDLVHRSEFDMLTDIQNRFAFEKRLQELITDARQTAGMFGLIYIDLNDFKQVNDRFGHQAGDLYLQRVAERMKHQLRPGDMLARLGGDEFGALVPVLHSRGEAEEIAHRLEHCFDEPFEVKNQILSGTASFGIALYPTDGVTDDGLMSIADAAMYVEKRMRNGGNETLAGQASRFVADSHD